jgi:putative oxidoreductase
MSDRVVNTVTLVGRILLGGLFVLAGVLKLGDPKTFATEIGHYQLFPELAPWLAVMLPPVEIVVGGALLVAPALWRRAAALAALGLLLMFTVAVGHALHAHINVDCGCFGSRSGSVDAWTLLRDLGLIGVAALVLVFTRPRLAPA